MDKHEFLKEILTRQEAQELAGMTRPTFLYHVNKGHIKPAKESGTGTGKVQLFWREDVENLKVGNYNAEKD
ncbi:hypothetical protein JCM19037_518 [Geomicrobium sp. JCM 19037]|uniref:hypothetical protein n=1 Tax=Geomicrobium sp. JCM 19037 TaxID=1460634 RepID=UPI00045F483A|nr:hypothetical protein [Geomicrobium sp. JCM 19037]GAK02292.1 hypothetical protein JCM19037_518 [Geomicrobium sp. JCM 19037]